MQYTKEQKAQARQELKAAGYKLSIKTTFSPFTGAAFEHVSIITPDNKKLPAGAGNVLAYSEYSKHSKAFDIVQKIFNPSPGRIRKKDQD